MKKIEIKEFFKNPTKRNFQISPDRKKIAFLDSYKKRTNIYIMDLETKKIKIITKQQKRNINSYSWKNNDYIYYLQDNNGDENYHVWIVDLKTLKVEDITPQENLKVFSTNSLNKEVYIKNIKKHKNKIYILHNGENAQKSNSYLYDIKLKKWEKVEEFDKGETAIILDEKTLKSKYISKIDRGYILIIKNGKEIKKIKSSDSFEIIDYTSNDKKELYVLSNIDRDKIGLFKTDTNANIISNCLFESKIVDIQNIIQNYKTKKLEKAIYMQEKHEIHYFDKKLEKEMKIVKNKLIEKFPNEKKSIISCSYVLGSNKELILIDTYSDKKPIDEYLFDVKKNEIIKLTENYKWFEHMVDMKPISYKARDGLIIHGYLTLPKNTKKPIPIIVNPHGGPWTRDYWNFNKEIQFFANRGYGILQMNFRISTGYGKKHFIKGWKQWGLKCQDDVTDGTKWLIKKGYTKNGQIGIYGGSYGGYATLMGIIREPKLYSAAVDYVGVSNMFTFWDSLPPYWEAFRPIMEKWMGNPYDDKKNAKLISPYYRVNEIETPLFVVQGAKDPRVPKKESDQIVDSLRKRNKKVQYMVKDDEGHGFQNQENRFELYEKMINFFDKNLKNN